MDKDKDGISYWESCLAEFEEALAHEMSEEGSEEMVRLIKQEIRQCEERIEELKK